MSPKTKKARQRSTPQADRPNFRRDDVYLKVSGFKAIGNPIEIRVAPLTVISGTNSAGKSSFMQPFLVMKQTLESSFDPGPLLLHGPNAKFTDVSQTLARGKSRASQSKKFTVSLRSSKFTRTIEYRETTDGYAISRDTASSGDETIRMSDSMSRSDLDSLENTTSDYGRFMLKEIRKTLAADKSEKPPTLEFVISRNRCFLDVNVALRRERRITMELGGGFVDTHTDTWSELVRGIIHVPGLRGNPEREYPRSAVGKTYPGTLETYVASIILDWSQSSSNKIDLLAKELERLGLTWKVTARKVNDAAVELLVGRMPHAQQGGALDMVSVADVGFGVSQTLPVVVALLAANPGQVVYLEQPEIHLHPRAQVQLAKTLVDASKRGVKVITETHSSLLIRALQTEIASGNIAAKDVSLNWFSRDDSTGFSHLDVAELDDKGRFGDWPLDFDEISQDADLAYIEAIGFGS